MAINFQNGSVNVDGYATHKLLLIMSRHAKARNYAPLDPASSDEGSKLTTFSLESFGRIGKIGNEFVDQVTASAVDQLAAKRGCLFIR